MAPMAFANIHPFYFHGIFTIWLKSAACYCYAINICHNSMFDHIGFIVLGIKGMFGTIPNGKVRIQQCNQLYKINIF